jgi:hypothetical protein
MSKKSKKVKEALINGVLRGLRPLSGVWGGAPQGFNQCFLKETLIRAVDSFIRKAFTVYFRLLAFISAHDCAIGYIEWGS